MANMCWVEMEVLGTKEDIEKFSRALNQEGNVWVGRGLDGSYDEIEPISSKSDICWTKIYGDTKWSAESSLIDCAISMAEQKKIGEGRWSDISKNDEREFIDLVEACRRFNVDMELYSSEPGCCFEEHMSIIDGDMVENESVEMEEFDLDYLRDYEEMSREAIEEEVGRKLTEEEWEEESFVKKGGFEDWTCWDIKRKIEEIKKCNDKDYAKPKRNPVKENKQVAKSVAAKSVEKGR